MSEAAHHAHIDQRDKVGIRVGIQASILAILLSAFTIAAHRAHTETIILQDKANNEWSHYQAKRIRDYQLEINAELINLISSNNPNAKKIVTDYNQKHAEYKNELTEIKNEAESASKESLLQQKKATYFDLAEGVLEISLVLSSLYFISRKKFFPIIGFLFGVSGTITGLIGFFI